jgi:hypothetical protein
MSRRSRHLQCSLRKRKERFDIFAQLRDEVKVESTCSLQNCPVQQLLEEEKNFQPSMTFDTKERGKESKTAPFIYNLNHIKPNYALWACGTKSKLIQPTRSK